MFGSLAPRCLGHSWQKSHVVTTVQPLLRLKGIFSALYINVKGTRHLPFIRGFMFVSPAPGPS